MEYQTSERKMLCRKEVCEILGISESTLLRNVKKKLFPQPIRVGQRAVRWPREIIEEFRFNGMSKPEEA